MNETALWSYFAQASMVVKLVMLILLAASIWSWTIIFQRSLLLRKTKAALKRFEEAFWSGTNLTKFYADLSQRRKSQFGLAEIFLTGFKAFADASKTSQETRLKPIETSERMMRVAQTREVEKLESHLSFLATIGSTSPYIGLFGTVWGIMTAFHALGNVQQATIAMVAPGISEALIATAMGLFAAIPAVIFYNRFAQQVNDIANQYELFKDELVDVLSREATPNQDGLADA
ncbi:MAG: protein TolQ [Pseudomonadota bacterium]